MTELNTIQWTMQRWKAKEKTELNNLDTLTRPLAGAMHLAWTSLANQTRLMSELNTLCSHVAPRLNYVTKLTKNLTKTAH